MLINQVPEKNKDPDKEHPLAFNNNLEENVNSELFEIEEIKYDENNLCTRDLVKLYENMDHCSKTIHISKNTINKVPNHYVETVIYKDDLDSDDSDVSEIYSNEDVHNVIMINDERIDILNTIPSFQAALCHKYGSVNMETACMSNEYDKQFWFNDDYIKDQLNIHSIPGYKYSDSTVIPPSLLDYICCKRLEDNYSFHMDNIIKYVQHTIEQLKRISNGDYLTGTAKEKWREVNRIHKENESQNNGIVSCANVPVQMKRKSRRFNKTWDDKVHSEMDIRGLKKILQKRIYLQVPKILSGTYTLFGKYFDNKLIVSCKKDIQLQKYKKNNNIHKNIKKSHVNMVLKLQCSNTGKVDNNMNSVMVLSTSLLDEQKTEKYSVIEISSDYDERTEISCIENDDNCVILKSTPSLSCHSQSDFNDNIKSEESNVVEEFTEPYPSTDELSYTMRRLNMHSPVLEESEDTLIKKRKSPSRIRIKSPYENRSYVIEEKKRKKLLEIKEKREKKKMVINENHKVTKPKYGKGAIMAHSSYSVTKLSITNKSFYNSIYGQTLDNKSFKKTVKRHKIDHSSSLDLDHDNEEKNESGSIPNKEAQNYISRSYYLDDADTEIMHLPIKSDSVQDVGKEIGTRSTSTVSNDVDNLSIIKRLFTNVSVSDLSGTDTMSSFHKQMLMVEEQVKKNDFLKLAQSNEALVPTNTPTQREFDVHVTVIDKKAMTTECRTSINKIYDLMKIKNESGSYGLRTNKNNVATAVTKESFSTQSCDSGSSNKHQTMSSNINKDINSDLATVIPKVIINSKQRTPAVDNKVKKEVKRYDTSKIINNPLKAISQLLHDIDNVQKTRQKGGNERRSSKKSENVYPENKTKVLAFKRNTEINTIRLQSHKEKNLHQNSPNEKTKPASRLYPEKPANRLYRKNVIDIIDEVKELKGEAVRGPSRRSRLDNLAQPKKSYVQAQYEQYQNRHEKQFVTDRQKVGFPNKERLSPAALKRQRKFVDTSTLSTKQAVVDSATEKTVNFKIPYRDNNLEDHEMKIPANTKRPSSCTKTNSFLNTSHKKNVSVESYTNNIQTRNIPALPRHDNNENSRAPLIPVCMDLESVTSSPSAEGSNALGNKLHLMINSITNTNSGTNALTEIKEPLVKFDKDDKKLKTVPHEIYENEISTSDYCIDVFEDKNIVTAVACISEDNQNIESDKVSIKQMSTYEVKNSESELHKLENALHNQISTGTFQKRLKIKKLTLTPKHSIQEAFVLNSGDTDALLVKSTLSRQFGFSKTDMSEIKPIPVLSNMIINRTFPIQISTVGYAFLKHFDHNIQKHTGNEILNLKDKSSKNSLIALNSPKIKELCHKSFQCNMKTESEPNNPDMLKMTKDIYVRPECNKVDNSSEIAEGMFEDLFKINDVTLEDKNTDNEINVMAKSDNISTSTSLDILVGLLNEIKKITSCQANFVKCSKEVNLNTRNKELEVLLNNVPIRENSPDVSITSSSNSFTFVNKKEGLKMSPALQTHDDDNGLELCRIKTGKENIFDNLKRICFDKELTVKMSQKEIKHAFTNVPSQFIITTVNRSTDFTNFFNSTDKHFSRSITTLYDCNVLNFNSSNHKIIESPKYPNEVSVYNNAVENEVKSMRNYNSIVKKMTKTENIMLSEFDPTMKIKRDILVTMYSILVLTIFTALTFPDLLPPA